MKIFFDAPDNALSVIAAQAYKKRKKNIFCLCNTEADAENIASELKFLLPKEKIFLLNSWDGVPFDKISPSPLYVFRRMRTLAEIANFNGSFILVASLSSVMQKLPPKDILQSASLTIKHGMKINRNQFITFLIKNSFLRVETALDTAEFAVRGEIVDLVLYDIAVRISFEWDKISSIKIFDPESQISNKSLEAVTIYSASEIVINNNTVSCFKEKFPNYFETNEEYSLIINALENGIKYNSYEFLMPLFYPALENIFSITKNFEIILPSFYAQYLGEYSNFIEERFSASKLVKNLTLPSRELYLDLSEIETIIEQNTSTVLQGNDNKNYLFTPDFYIGNNLQAASPILSANNYIKERIQNKVCIIACLNKNSQDRLKTLFSEYETPISNILTIDQAKIGFINLVAGVYFQKGFETDEYLIITEKDLFGEKFTKARNVSKTLKKILAEAESLVIGELVVHKDHGLGRYLGIETLKISDIRHDCLKLLYAADAKLYIPVENIDLVKKYGSEEGDLDKLGGLAWQTRKSKLKKRINEIAAKLIKLAAERKNSTATPIEVVNTLYENFCAKFPYLETEDQLNSAADIKKDLESGKPMDRLLCGDVGFGKTEVAMRAAFMVLSENMNSVTSKKCQVAIITPTTILCKQHFHNFTERFKDYPIKIRQLSSFINPKDVKKIKEDLASGEIDLVIGTHALLADSCKWLNLTMVIIDEEHHFGVKQKEKLKELKSNIHMLALSATPIPRSLQMSLFNLRDLSIIASPPTDRLSPKISVNKFDQILIKEALLKEHFRGGKSFIVVPRIVNIPEIEEYLTNKVPELKYKILHGQMKTSDIDFITNDFYEGKFDILVATSIIESGLDVPNANTIIITNAEVLGLSQLYQLKGRVGRGSVRGYVYICLRNDKAPTEQTLKRLEVMSKADHLGAGFTIASHDMDIRGFGNLIGEEQSGHIKEVGVELYQDMLEEAIAAYGRDVEDIDKTNMDEFSPNVNLNIPIFIPEDYISDEKLRMSIYKRAGDIKILSEIIDFKEELYDRFGAIPIEVYNLLEIIKIKIICKELLIEKLDYGTKGLIFKFSPKSDSSKILKFVEAFPSKTKLRPDDRLLYLEEWDPENSTKIVLNILEKISTNL